MEVLVAGAGIAGTALALALHDAGVAVSLHEAHPSGSGDAGAFLTLAEPGMRALARLGADGPVLAASRPLRTMRLSSGDGTELGSRPLGEPGGPGYRYLTRARLCAVLQEEARRRGIGIRWGARVTGFEPAAPGLTAVFADGTRAGADVLVGADGLRSAVRGLVDPGGPPPRYAGQRVYYGRSVAPEVRGEPDRIHFVRGATAFGYLLPPGAGAWWFARVTGPELDREQVVAGTAQRWRAGLADLLRDEPVPLAIVRGAEQVLVTNAYDLADRPWHRDRAIVIGDAAHAASPATGQGASMALEDAVALARALRDEPDAQRAFAAYERERRERVEANTAAAAGISRST